VSPSLFCENLLLLYLERPSRALSLFPAFHIDPQIPPRKNAYYYPPLSLFPHQTLLYRFVVYPFAICVPPFMRFLGMGLLHPHPGHLMKLLSTIPFFPSRDELYNTPTLAFSVDPSHYMSNRRPLTSLRNFWIEW